MNKIDDYLDYKLIQVFMNDDDTQEKLQAYEDILLSGPFMNNLYSFVDKHVKNNELNKKQLKNIIKIINYIRFNSKQPDTKRINDMIGTINISDDSNESIYYIENYIGRFAGHGFFKNISNSKKRKDLKPIIIYSNFLDYLYLSTLISVPEEEFLPLAREAMNNEYFLLSVNQILYEFPELLDNETFAKRLRTIVEFNLKIDDLYESNVRKKIIKKRSLYYYNLTKKEE